MHKWMYDRMVAEYSKKSKEELIQEIISLQEIELSDRAFANECEAGTSVYNINELFSVLKDLKEEFTCEKVLKTCELMDRAESSWNFIVREIAEMNDDERQSKTLEDFKNRLSNVANVNDNI